MRLPISLPSEYDKDTEEVKWPTVDFEHAMKISKKKKKKDEDD